MPQPFHLAIPVDNLEKAREFYGELLGCKQGRSDTQWIDWDLAGHQLVTHLVKAMPSAPEYNVVDGHSVPVPHFGVVLTMEDWQALADKLTAASNTNQATAEGPHNTIQMAFMPPEIRSSPG